MFRRNLSNGGGLLFVVIIFAVGCETDKDDYDQNFKDDLTFWSNAQDRPIQEIVAQTFVLQDFEALMVATRVSGEMQSPPYTVFPPWNRAFEALPYWNKMTTDRAWYGHLRDLLLGHIHQGNISKADLKDEMTITMLNGDEATISPEGSRARVDGIRTIADTAASDGHLYMLEAVREPRWLARTVLDVINSDERFSVLAEILNHPSMSAKRAELQSSDSGLTFFAPTNDALRGFRMEECVEPECSQLLGLIVGTHVVDALVPKLFTPTQSFQTLAGSTIDWNYDAQSVTCRGERGASKETSLGDLAEEFASNGIVYPIDKLFCLKVGNCVGSCGPDQCGAIDDGCGGILYCENECEQKNIALNKPAEQSSVEKGGVPAKAVDGKKDRAVDYAYTKSEDKPWWQVDFGTRHTVNGVKIWTVKGKEYKIQDLNVEALDENGAVLESETFSGIAGETIELPIAAKNVFSIRIQSNVATNLAMCEVEVYGFEQTICEPNTCEGLVACGPIDDGCGTPLECGGCDEYFSCEQSRCVKANIAENRFTKRSDGGDSSPAADGNTNRLYTSNSCVFIGKEWKPWWKVDFLVPHTVIGVKIWSLAGWEQPLNDIHVDYLDENDNVIATKSFVGTAGSTIEFDIQAQGVHAVKVQGNTRDRLPLCEVEVYGSPEAECVPKTCEEVHFGCGTTLGGCGDFLDCGGCGEGYACEDNQCEKICPVQSCADLGAECGHVYTNCQATQYCGDCSEGSTCYQNECVTCTPKTCSEISPSPCGYVDDGCGNLIDCGECENATILVPMSLGKEESWEELAFLASVPVSMHINDGRPSVLAVAKEGQLDEFQSDYLRRYSPGSVYTVGKQGLYDGDIKLNASSLDEITCELAQLFGTSDVAVMSSSADYHKSLSASGLAGRLRAPLFFFDGGTVSSETLTCLGSLGVTRVITVGSSGQVVSALGNAGIANENLEDEFDVISWLETEGHGVDYFAVCNSHDRSKFFAPKSSLAAPVLAAARNGAVVPLAMDSEFQTPCVLTLTDQKPKGAAQGVPYDGEYQWKTGTCQFNGQSYNVALSRHREGNVTFGQGNIDFNGNGDFSDPGEFFLKGELRDFGDKTYLIDLDSRFHFADVKLTYPHADALKARLQQFHDTLGHHPKYMVLVGLPDAIPPHLIVNQVFDLTATHTDYIFADVDDDPLIDIALGRMLGESAAVMTLAAARSTTYEDLLDYRWKNKVLSTGNFDQPREERTKRFENRGFNVDNIRSYNDIPAVEYSYVVHQDHGYHNSAPYAISGKSRLVPTSPAVVQSIGCQIGNISYFVTQDYNFSYFGAVNLAKMGVVGFYGAAKNSGGNTAAMRADYIYNALIYDNATLGEAFRDSLNAVMLFTDQDSTYVWRPQFYGDPALNPYEPDIEPAIKPGKTVVDGDRVTAHAPEGYWITHHWDGYCGDPESFYGYDGPGLVQISAECYQPKSSRHNIRNTAGRRYIAKFTVDRAVTNIVEQEGIDVGLGFNHDNLSSPDAHQFRIDKHPDGSSTVYMNLRFQFFDHWTGEFDKKLSQIEYFIE